MTVVAMVVVVLAGPFLAAFAFWMFTWRAIDARKGRDRVRDGYLGGLAVLLAIDVLLVFAFLWAIVVFNCHAGYECPF
jgi:hypothetical protein